MKKLTVLHYTYNKESKKTESNLIEVEDTLANLQKLVDGSIEIYPLTNNIMLVCNDEGKMIDLPLTAIALSEFSSIPEYIVGDFFVCRRHGEDLTSLKLIDISTVQKRVIPIDKIKKH